jgi:excisionase family DNA binding protein
MPPPRTQLTVTETAAALGVTRRVVHNRIQSGAIPATKLPGATGPYLIDPAVVETLLAIAAAKAATRAERLRKRAERGAAAAAA